MNSPGTKRTLTKLLWIASIASVVTAGGISVAFATTGTPTTGTALTTTQSTYGVNNTGSGVSATNPQDVAAAKSDLSSYLNSVQSLIASDPALAQTGAGAKVKEQQQVLSSMSDTSLQAFYAFVQSHPGWKNWVTQEQTVLQNVQALEKKASIQVGTPSSGTSNSSTASTNTQNTNSSIPASGTGHLLPSSTSSTSTTVTATSSTTDTLTVTINPTINPVNTSQGNSQTISDPTVINYTNVPAYPTPNQAFSAQLAADLMGLGANIAQSAAGDAPAELIVVAVGEGSAVPDPARIAAEAVAIGLYSAQEGLQETANYLNMQMTNNNNTQAGDLASLSTNMYNNLLTTMANVATVNNNINTVNQNIATLNSNVSVVDKHVQTLSYRDIEQDLANNVDLVSLYLPVKDGGHLEDVENFVQTLINESSAAGLKTNQAQKFFTEGQTNITAGAYKKAYMNFVQAYQQLQAGANP
ncbi:hypothetical protein JZ785_20485 [Alicyclobacillus curvatus]|nr:hypothetical protein JZ785_20485 [Alicyclobacillus curvatus]